jgi:hypothetical protein
MAAGPGMAQQVYGVEDPDWLRCANWTSVGDKQDTWRHLYVIEFENRSKVLGEFHTPEGRRRGIFEIRPEIIWAVLSNPNSDVIGSPIGEKVRVQFTLSLRDAFLFRPEDDRRLEYGAISGFLELSQALFRKIRAIRPVKCVATTDGWGEPGSKLLGDFDPAGKPLDTGTDPAKKPLTLSGFAEEPKRAPDSGTKPPRLSELDPGKSAPAKPDTAERDPANRDKLPSAPKPPGAIASVCAIDAAQPQPVSLAAGFMPVSLQTVGFRNNDTGAEKFDYHPYPDATVPLGSTFDLTDSRGKLVPYDTVARDGADLWVSLTGIEEPRTSPRDASVKADSLLRIMVVGGPAEVAMSGLDGVDVELKSLGAGRIGLNIEWHVVGSSGTIVSVERYNSFDKMVKAARDKAAGGIPDVLNEDHIQKLLDDFENRLKARSEPVEKVFWIKGAYSIPSSIPPRFEKFIKTSSEAVATGTRRSGKWFVLVTARMTGFSINYLKEPIYSLQIGDLIEEGEGASSRPRRFIKDKDMALLATRLQIAAAPAPAQTPGAVIGKLVFKAADVFDQRGYILSPESLKGLQNHLKLVASTWDDMAANRENLAAWAAGKTRKKTPTVVDLLQSADDRTSQLALPRMIPPDWARTAISILTPEKIASAKTFIDGYMDGVDRAAISADGKRDHCQLFYAPEAFLGFGSNP